MLVLSSFCFGKRHRTPSSHVDAKGLLRSRGTCPEQEGRLGAQSSLWAVKPCLCLLRAFRRFEPPAAPILGSAFTASLILAKMALASSLVTFPSLSASNLSKIKPPGAFSPSNAFAPLPLAAAFPISSTSVRLRKPSPSLSIILNIMSPMLGSNASAFETFFGPFLPRTNRHPRRT
eukprot:UN4817